MLVKNIATFRLFVPAKGTLKIESLTPFINNVEDDIIKPLLGEDLYNRLDTYTESTGSLSDSAQEDEDKTAQLLYFAQKSVSNLALYFGFNLLSFQISEKGIQRIEDDTNKTLYKNQEYDTKNQLKTTGYNALDTLLSFLEENIEYFPEFEETETYTSLKSSIIKNTATLNKFYDIGNSRLVFVKLQRFIDRVILLEIKPILGETIYNEILTEIVKSSPAAKITALLPYVQAPVAYLAVANGIDELGYDITDRGVLVDKASTYVMGMTPQQSDDDKVFKLARKAEAIAERYIEQLKMYLVSKAADFPSYSGQTGSVIKRDNTDKKTVWM
jgi:hypothetical protein